MATKVTTATGTTGAALPVELGFVPTSVKIRNRTSGVMMEWNDKMVGSAPGLVTTLSTGNVMLSNFTSSAGVTLLDGSDKVSNLTKSYGIIIAAAATVNATDEVLEIVADRKDM